MKFSMYPEKIHQIEVQLLEARLMYETSQDELMSVEAEIKSAIANNKEYTNESKRKAAEKEAKSDQRGEYYQTKLRVKNQQIVVLQLEIELKLWRDRFSVAKLEKREKIANLQESSLVA